MQRVYGRFCHVQDDLVERGGLNGGRHGFCSRCVLVLLLLLLLSLCRYVFACGKLVGAFSFNQTSLSMLT
jgi:hypothetical protein